MDYFQKDLLISNPQGSLTKTTLKLSATGDIQLVSGQNKLSSQLIRTLINDDSPLQGEINKKTSKGNLTSIVASLLRNFKLNQLDIVNGQDPYFVGYFLYRKAAGFSDDFIKITNNIIQWSAIDTNVLNNNTYTYALTKKYSNGAESLLLDINDIVPTASSPKIFIGNDGIFVAGNQSITVYTPYNLFFQQDELLNDIENIDIIQDKQEPRRYNILLTINTLAGNSLTISSQRINPSTLQAI